MQETLIGSEISNPNQKFIYEYDFNKVWHFMIELITVDKEENKNSSIPVASAPKALRLHNMVPRAWSTPALQKWKKNTTCRLMHYRMDLVKKERAEKQSLKKKRQRKRMGRMTGFR